MSTCDVVDDAVMDVVYSRAFRGRSSMDHITEEHILEELRGEAGMLDTALSALEFKIE